jgi:HEAT repeat protein
VVRIGLILSALLFIATATGVYLAYYLDPAKLDLHWYGGKSRTEWLRQLEDSNRDERQQAADALAQLGPPVIDDLLKCLQESPQPVRDAAMTALARIGEPALEPLRKAALDPMRRGHRDRFRAAITGLGPPVTAAVAGWLDSAVADERRLALHVLAELPPAPESVLPRVGRLMNTGDYLPEVIRLLASLGPDGIEPLLQIVNGPSPDDSLMAITTLGAMGPSAESAAPELRRLRETAEGHRARVLSEALEQIQAREP